MAPRAQKAQKTIPRNYYKKPRAFSPLGVSPTKVFPTIQMGGIGVNKTTTARIALMKQIIPAVVQAERTAKVAGTLNSYEFFRRQGNFHGDYALLVDGSPNRPVKNVKFLGSIIIQEEPSVDLIVDAAVEIAKIVTAEGLRLAKYTPPYVYTDNFVVLLDEDPNRQIPIGSLPGLMDSGEYFESIQIYNSTPYAGKLERFRAPNGIFYLAWKTVTNIQDFRQLGIAHYYMQSLGAQSTSSTARRRGMGRSEHTVEGRPIMVPAITIGYAGAVLNKAVRPGTTVAGRAASAAARRS